MNSFVSRWLAADEAATDNVGWAANLAIFRMVYLYAAIVPALVAMLHWIVNTMPTIPVESWQPVSFYQLIPLEVVRNVGFAHALALIDLFLIVLGLLGFCTRATLTLATILSLYVFGLTQNQGKTDHTHHEIWLMALLAAGPSGEMFSIDAILRAIRGADRGKVTPEVSKDAALVTLCFIWLLIGLIYFGAGIGKLVAAFNAHWLSSTNLQNLIRHRWVVERLYQQGDFKHFRFDNLPPAVLVLGGFATIMFELSAPMLAVLRRFRPLMIAGGIVFHLLTGVVLGIWFKTLMVAYFSMLDWAWIGTRAMNRIGRVPIAVLYDGRCKLCRRVISIVMTFDMCNRLTPIASETLADSGRTNFPHITNAMLAQDLYAVTAAVSAAGYDAYVLMAASIPLLWPLALIMRLPLVASVGRRCYRRVADSRHCRVTSETAPPLKPIAPGEQPVTRAPQLIGVFLVVGEAVTIALNSGLAFGVTRVNPTTIASSKTLAAWRKVRWSWPFDQYPTFAYDWDLGTYTTWEPRLVYADGSESAISARVFAFSFHHHLSLLEANAQQMLKDEDPVTRRRRGLDLVAILWPQVPKKKRRGVVAIRDYESVFSTDPDVIEPLSRKLLDTYPIQELQPGADDHRLDDRR